MSDNRSIKQKIIAAGYKAVDELIKVAEEPILKGKEEEADLGADKLKNAAVTKKLAIFDAFEILNRIELESENLDDIAKGINTTNTKQGFAERKSSKQ
jgi:hypothetical protein